MRKLIEQVEEVIKNEVAEHNRNCPNERLFTSITNLGNPREWIIQSHSHKFDVSISRIFINETDKKLPHLTVRITDSGQEFNFEYFSIKNAWWSSRKKNFCDLGEIKSCMSSLFRFHK